MMHLLAWRPFLDPLNLHEYWWAFLFPLSFGVAFTYKAVRVRDLRDFPRQTAIMTAQIIAGMILIGAGVFVFLEYLAPLILPVNG
jgi:hypothetical protein